MANTAIYREITTTGNTKIFTFSSWVKRTSVGVECAIWGGWGQAANTRCQIRFKADNTLNVEWGVSGTWYSLITTRLFRDPAAWYHIVLAYDSNQATPADREKLYINGVQETSFSTETYVPQDTLTMMTTDGDEVIVGASNGSGSLVPDQNWFKGVQSHIQMVDGLALAPTEFGEFDSTSGIWKIKTGCYGTPGTNGFCLKMEDSSNLDLDSSSNAHTFTTIGTLTPTKDNTDNNYCTLEGGLITPNSSYDPVYSNGNLTVITSHTSGGHDFGGCSTLGLQAGLWYWEIYINNITGDSIQGVYADPQKSAYNNKPMGLYEGDMGYVHSGQSSYNTGSGHTTPSYGDTYTAGDYIGCYLDLTANKMYFAKNGTLQASGVGLTMVVPADLIGDSPGAYFPGTSAYTTGASTFDLNFGNGYFGTTAISGAVADEGGEGLFKYNPSTGTFDSSSKNFRAICTKNIATYG